MPPKKEILKESMDVELIVLINKKQRIFEQMQNIYDMSSNLSDIDSKELFLMCAKDIDNLRSAFEKCVFEIFELELKHDENSLLRNQELKIFDDLYFRTKLISSNMQFKLSNDDSSNVSQTVIQSRPRLPKLELFNFDGNIEHFITFYETFCSLVHNQPHIPKIDKFHYLLSCTKGSAQNIVKSIPISASNYDIVWQSLLDKYHDSRMLVGRYLDKMLNFQPLTKESSTQLNNFIETFEHSYKAIESLNIEDLKSYILCHIALRALDPCTRKSFEQNLNQKCIPTFSELMSYIHNQIKILDHSASYTTNPSNKTYSFQNERHQNIKPPVIKSNRIVAQKNYAYVSYDSNQFNCLHCGENHMIYRCAQFRKLNPSQRISRAENLKLCQNCLKSNHSTSECRSDFKCMFCGSMHHSLLHGISLPATTAKESVSAPSCTTSLVDHSNVMNNYNASSLHSSSTVLLGTAIVHVLDNFNSYQPCRVLIDSGAQSNFISFDCLQRLGLSQRQCPFNIYGLAGDSVKNYGMTSCVIKPRHNTNSIFNINAVVLPKITTDLPTVQIPENVIGEYKHLFLADPYFYKKSPIDIILAAEVFPYIYDGKKLVINFDIPVALSSIFGYVITGKLITSSMHNVADVNVVASTTLVSYTIEDNHLNETLKRFWEVESSPCEIPLSPDDEIAERLFKDEHYRDETGRYVSPILLKPDHDPLGDSYETAYRRLLQVERRLIRSPVLQKAYSDFLKEYQSLGHMEPYQGTEPTKYFIPHHCVLRPTSTTTPLRVVFDGSQKTSNGVSLNNVLLTGRKLLQDISKILINFRLYDVCFTADVSKMYRAVLIRPTDRRYQHILWRETPLDRVKIYELKTNTYGLRSAPYVAIRTLHQLAHDERSDSLASQVLLEGFYVDDVLWSCKSVSEACDLQDGLTSLLKKGGFDLRKWTSNCPELLTRMKSDQVTEINFQDDTLSSSLKVLGLTWLPGCDSFSFSYNLNDDYGTKRSVLKLLASIYDPIGFISPCTFVAKCIMQDVWKLSLGWDDHLPLDLLQKWKSFISHLPTLSQLRIERHLLIPAFVSAQLIGFCDASSQGYAACIYIRSIDDTGSIKIRLLTSKSKVAPLKPLLSIPRLELMAAVLLSKLIRFVVQNIKDFHLPIIALSDSSVVLSWLQTPPYKLKVFVANRVSEIIDVIPPNCWFHVSSENNAADLCSRGTLPQQLLAVADTWYNGPRWLSENPQTWPTNTFFLKSNDIVPEIKTNIDTFTFNSCQHKNKNFNELEQSFNQISSFNKLQRVIAWCYRFITNLKTLKSDRKCGPLESCELQQGHNLIIRVIQNNYFQDEIQMLSKGSYVPSLRKLSPFVDSKGFLRVGGRILQSDLSYSRKHPLLLPKKCHTTNLIIEYFHKLYLHVGPRTLQGILCNNYWIISARSVIRSILLKCSNCYKFKPSSSQPLMGTLPASRLKPDKVFNHVGCDIGGPFLIKESIRRNAKISKAYLCLFICFATKAVHLEVLTDLTCDCFLATFDRFVARRGLCNCLYSDCGTNFIAAAKHLKEVHKFLNITNNRDRILEGLSTRCVEWRTNPPNAASMGGLWEAGIKSAKHHLYRVVGEKALTFEELTTLFCKIEAVMNSRPLCSLSDNPNEFEVLTAGHFLIGQNLLAVPEYNFDDVKFNQLSRWQCLQKLSQTFWKRWSNDYLHTLQQREKWFSCVPNVKKGDLVLLKSNLTKSLQWPLGRIEEVHPGIDNVVRVVTVRTKNGIFKRPVNKICPLPYAN